MSRQPSPSELPWSNLPKEQLLDCRICDLRVNIQGTELEGCLQQLRTELQARGIQFMPHTWLSDEWFCPDGIPGFAIPFFLAHPRLKRLENEMMLEVEGGNIEWCMKLMRHETAHALVNAYRVHRLRQWQTHFGRPSQPYPTAYLPKPYSRRFVTHLDNWYAQSHPHEDWAETFAVWLQPDSQWQSRYAGWPALKKLKYVDQLMQHIGKTSPRIINRKFSSPVSQLKITLRQYYEKKQAYYRGNRPEFYDRDLLRLFSNDSRYKTNIKASLYIKSQRREVVAIVSRWSAEYRYRIDQVLKDMIQRCDQLDLHIADQTEDLKLQLVACVTMLTMNYLQSGRFNILL